VTWQGLQDYLKWRETFSLTQKDLEADRARLAFSKRAYARSVDIYSVQALHVDQEGLSSLMGPVYFTQILSSTLKVHTW